MYLSTPKDCKHPLLFERAHWQGNTWQSVAPRTRPPCVANVAATQLFNGCAQKVDAKRVHVFTGTCSSGGRFLAHSAWCTQLFVRGPRWRGSCCHSCEQSTTAAAGTDLLHECATTAGRLAGPVVLSTFQKKRIDVLQEILQLLHRPYTPASKAICSCQAQANLKQSQTTQTSCLNQKTEASAKGKKLRCICLSGAGGNANAW